MSKLDQAFIRAYAQETAGLAAPHVRFAGPNEPGTAARDEARHVAPSADQEAASSDCANDEHVPGGLAQGDPNQMEPPGEHPPRDEAINEPPDSTALQTEPPSVEELYRPVDAAHQEHIPAPHARFFTAPASIEPAASPESVLERLKTPSSQTTQEPPSAVESQSSAETTAHETSAELTESVPAGEPSGEEVPRREHNAPPNTAGESTTEHQPAFAVDQFAWPRVVAVLSKVARKQLEPLFTAIQDASRHNQRRIAFAGTTRGAGSTSLLLLAARHLAERGQRVVIVDGDFQSAGLAQSLGLQPEVGWREALDGELSLFDTMIESVDDHLALLPLLNPLDPSTVLANPRLSAHLDELQAAYELVLVRCCPLDAEQGNLFEPRGGAEANPCLVDAAILVDDARIAAPQRPAALDRRLERCGLAWWGSVQNFAPAA